MPNHNDHSFLIRVWRRTHGTLAWLLEVENRHTGELHHFKGLYTVFAFLEEIAAPEPTEDTPPAAPD